MSPGRRVPSACRVPLATITRMFQHLPPPPDLLAWVEAAVLVRSTEALPHTRFPAMVASMLVAAPAWAR